MGLIPVETLIMMPSATELQKLTNYDIVDSMKLELTIVFMIIKLFTKSNTSNSQSPQQPQISETPQEAGNQAKTSEINTWGYYGAEGPSNWINYTATCAGQSQSPIDIQTGQVRVGNFGQINFVNYNSPAVVEVSNNGHTVNVQVLDNIITILGGGLNGAYQVAQFHFHWGVYDSLGSEHKINGRAFPLEMHIVHFKQSYGTLADAVIQPDGVAVLSILFQISSVDNPAFNGLLNTFQNVRNPKAKAFFSLPSLMALIPTFNNYFRYQGSLTTPPCSESVIWTIATDLVPISSNQMRLFRSLMSAETDNTGRELSLVNNFRPVQNIQGRQVMSNLAV